MSEQHDIMTVAEVAAYLRQSEEYVRQHSSTRTRPREPIIPAFKLGHNSIRYSRLAVRQFVEVQMNQQVMA